MSDGSAVNELLQTAVSALPNNESISMQRVAADPTRVVRCLPKHKCFSWKTAVEIIRDGTGPFKKGRLISAGECPVMGRFAVTCNWLGRSWVLALCVDSSCCLVLSSLTLRVVIKTSRWRVHSKRVNSERTRVDCQASWFDLC